MLVHFMWACIDLLCGQGWVGPFRRAALSQIAETAARKHADGIYLKADKDAQQPGKNSYLNWPFDNPYSGQQAMLYGRLIAMFIQKKLGRGFLIALHEPGEIMGDKTPIVGVLRVDW